MIYTGYNLERSDLRPDTEYVQHALLHFNTTPALIWPGNLTFAASPSIGKVPGAVPPRLSDAGWVRVASNQLLAPRTGTGAQSLVARPIQASRQHTFGPSQMVASTQSRMGSCFGRTCIASTTVGHHPAGRCLLERWTVASCVLGTGHRFGITVWLCAGSFGPR